jgi:putative ABC transport system permease protein
MGTQRRPLLACAGLGFGLIGAYFVGRTMQSALFGVGPMDFSAFASVGFVLLLAALSACYLLGRRAASVELCKRFAGNEPRL